MKVQKIETNLKRNLLLHSSYVKFSLGGKETENQVIRINPEITFQEILGFGGAFTESSCYVLSNIDKKLANQILDEYFLESNLNYQFGRISIGSCDFSLDSYSYSYKKDLSDFSIERDRKYVIPTIKLAQMRNRNLKILASPWSPPAFMKSNGSLLKGGKLLPQFKQLWAEYLVKFAYAYQTNGIPISYMTIQNEPNAKQIWESCLYDSLEEADLLKNYIFPTFKRNGLNTQFLIWDHNKDIVLERALQTLIDGNSLYDVNRYSFSLVYGWSF